MMPDSFLDDLTAAQREAVTHVDGPLLVLAGPGSGKTRVITFRIVHLLRHGVRPWQILALTFTNKAAGEMKQRVDRLAPDNRVWISTFHSLGVRLLRHYADRLGLDRNFTIYDQADRVRMVKSAIESCGIDNVRFTPETIQTAISKAKNQLLLPARYAAKANDFFSQVVAQVYAAYEKKMRDANALDFDDLLLWPALALQNDAELRAELDARFRYVLVDEYQDTNQAQYEIAKGLSQDFPNLCVVGDPDQSIYKWRGADLRNILDFEKDFPNARVVTLTENFRSTKAILAAADGLIAHNVKRKAKTLVTANQAGKPVATLLFETGVDEAEQIAARIQAELAAGRRHYRDFAVLVRITALTRGLETAFLRQRVPFQIVRGLAFFERKENKDVLAYLRLLLNPRDDISFLRIVNEPARGIGKTSLDHLQRYAEPRQLSLHDAAVAVEKIPEIKGKAAAGLRNFIRLMHDLRSLLEHAPDEVIRAVLERSGYLEALAASDDREDEDRVGNVKELITAAHQFHQEDPNRTLADFLENITLASDVDSWDDKQNCVAVMTLHAAKGLEFPVVYLLACEQGILPHERSLNQDEELEEERRLAFVGMTRAKEELYLTHCRLREFRGQTNYQIPSMFLDELPASVAFEDLSASGSGGPKALDRWRSGLATASRGWYETGEFAARSAATKPRAAAATADAAVYREGMLVQHETYGVGRVTSVTGHGALRKVKIHFRQSGERTFLADKARLTVVAKE
ncbi:MAG: UvrD-helicase domain-containing protein [Gemmataceae bacterium]|nr:UvrD-helicase domain-containing protein [Gemmataceae bacterium]